MKRIFALIFCVALMCAMSVMVFAETETIPEETSLVTETTAESETVSATEALAPEVTERTTFTTEEIVAWAKAHFEEISVVVSILVSAIYTSKNRKLLNKSISDTNHNAITVSENNAATTSEALNLMRGYKAAAEASIQKIKDTSEEEKRKLYEALATATNALETSKLANIELANEVAELLVLANIPNSKKEELYARHMAAVKNISEVKGAVTPEENNNDNGETK
jgi:hypothetical protein